MLQGHIVDVKLYSMCVYIRRMNLDVQVVVDYYCAEVHHGLQWK
jgi:hypothetical protein